MIKVTSHYFLYVDLCSPLKCHWTITIILHTNCSTTFRTPTTTCNTWAWLRIKWSKTFQHKNTTINLFIINKLIDLFVLVDL
eukprot:UN08515